MTTAPTQLRSPPAKHSSYCRERDLHRLLPLWPHQTADTSVPGRMRLIAVLRRALRAERRRGLSGHWSYDLGRHAQLLAAYQAERAALAACPDPAWSPMAKGLNQPDGGG